MKRVWLGLGVALAMTGCSKEQPASVNSAESVETTAVANIVATIPTPTPTPSATTDPGNATTPEQQGDLSNMVSNVTSED